MLGLPDLVYEIERMLAFWWWLGKQFHMGPVAAL
jgi:hypothetical protein